MSGRRRKLMREAARVQGGEEWTPRAAYWVAHEWHRYWEHQRGSRPAALVTMVDGICDELSVVSLDVKSGDIGRSLGWEEFE